MRKKDEIRGIVVCLYIDNTLYVGNKNAIEKFKRDIKKFFVTKEEGEVTFRKKQDTICLHQTDIIKKNERLFEKEIENTRHYKPKAHQEKES